MCGIFGILSPDNSGLPEEKFIHAAVDALSHRGPDDRGVYLSNGLALGHRRLAVIDLSPAGHQPMADAAGRYHIIFNGEIYNYRELREELSAAGTVFRSASDTEVLLQLYIQQGPKCLDRLNGFFSFAIYDSHEQSLFIARDRLGIKPLYYHWGAGGVAFASELKALEKAGLSLSLDYESLKLYLQFTYVPEPYCIYSEVRKLRAGHYLLLKQKDSAWKEHPPEEHRWYGLRYDTDLLLGERDYAETCRLLHEALDRSVQRRLISDVPAGAFLSGGVDSSIITALAARHHRDLHTFSVGYEDQPHFDETQHARLVAEHCHTRHNEYRFGMSDLDDALPSFLDSIDEPFADSSALPVYLLSRSVRKTVTVALSGDGSDELFAGYRKHRAEWMISDGPWPATLLKGLGGALSRFKGSRNSRWGNKVRQLQRFASGAGLSPHERYWRWATISDEEEATLLLADRIRKYDLKHQSEHRKKELVPPFGSDYDINRVLLADCSLVLPGDMLVKVDRMSMAHGLEVRNPFLDREVAELAFRMPVSFKINRNSQKRILKDTFAHLLPREIFERRKQGFEVPLNSLLLRKRNHELLMDTMKSGTHDVFEPAEVNRLMQQMAGGQPGDAPARIWSILVFRHWWNRKN